MLAAALLILALPGAGGATQLPPDVEEPDASAARLEVSRLPAPIELDGVVDEPAWDAIEPLRMTMFTPTFGEPVTERTEIRIAYDDEYLYVSGRLYDSDPSGIRTNTFYRDQYSGDDLLGVVIDSFNDYETALMFTTNPAGARTDRTISNDAVGSGGGPPMNWDWNAHWDVATTQTDEGWFAEMRIPFSTLAFQVREGEVTMGLIVYRFIARKNERQVFPAISPRWGGLAFAKPSQARRIVLQGVRATTPVQVTPYSLGGLTRIPELTEPPGSSPRWVAETERTTEVGVDVQVAPAPNLTLDFTANTDFAQVEADDQQINLTRFPLFFPEKRQFFQERSSTFEFSTGGRNRLFHSRRIGLQDGELVRIYGGARAVGRIEGTDFGFLTMQTASGAGRSSENTSVARINQQVLNRYSSVGAMVTSRLGSGGADNVAYGLDGLIRPFGDEWITLRWAQTFDERLDEGSALDAGLAQARWERIRDDGFSYWGSVGRAGEDFRPGLGFQDRTGFRFVGGQLQYQSFRDAESPLRSLTYQLQARRFLRTSDGTAQSQAVQPEWRMEFKGGSQLTFNTASQFESIRSPFSIAGLEVPQGDYWFHEGEVRLQRPRSATFRGQYSLVGGSFYDGTRIGLSLEPTWNPSSHLELDGGYEVNRIEFADRGAATTTHLARLRAQVALDTRVSLSVLAQYSNLAELTSVNARFRYHFREGTDLWIVYNEGFHTSRHALGAPPLPRSAGRSLMVKYTHAFVW